MLQLHGLSDICYRPFTHMGQLDVPSVLWHCDNSQEGVHRQPKGSCLGIWSQTHIDVTSDTKYYDRATQLCRIKKGKLRKHMIKQEMKTSIIL